MHLLVGTGAVDGMKRSSTAAKDAEFAEYMAARQPSLLRAAYLLTGNRHAAEELVQNALAKLYLSWDKVQRRDLLDRYVRRIMVNENNSLWRRAWKRNEVSTDDGRVLRAAAEQCASRQGHGLGGRLARIDDRVRGRRLAHPPAGSRRQHRGSVERGHGR